MKSMKAKSKNKKNSTKFGKIKFGTKETSNVITPDLSALRKPIDISVSRLSQVSKLLESGSDEVKAILAYECDIVYECRVCRSLFRSLVNFISHKRVYCKEKFNITLNKNTLTNDDEAYTKGSFIRLHIPEQEVVKENCNNDRILRSQANKEEQKKDLTTIIDMLQRKQRLCDNYNLQEMKLNKNYDNSNILYSNKVNAQYEIDKPEISIVYQNDLNETKTVNLQTMLNQNIGILGPNGQLLEKKDVYEDNHLIPSLANEEYNEFGIDQLSTTNLICSICNAKFSTKKTLTFHMKTLHTSHRICYPCPCCPSTFVNTWSVYRHLFKIHRMSNEQVRKLRIQIQEKAFRKEITHADDTEQDNAVSKPIEVIDLNGSNETREWMNHLETDSEIQRCGGCGKKFDRKAALFSHSQHCQRRIAAYNETIIKEKKTPKGSPETTTNSNTIFIVPVIAENSPEVTELNETSIRVENITTLTDADWDMIGNEHSNDSESTDIVSVSSQINVSQNQELFNKNMNKDSSPSNNTLDNPEIVYTSETVALKNGSKKRKVVIDNQLKVLNDIIGTNSNNSSNNISSTLNSSTDVRNQVDQTTIMENKIATIANLRKLQCLPCKRKFTSMTNLRRHMAIHIGWNRYRCKLCNFKCFVKYDCVAHCNKMHNAQNNRTVITDMVVEIPQNQYTCNEDIVIDVTNMEENVNEFKSVSSSNSLDRCKTKNVTVDKNHKNVVNTNVDNIKAGTKEVPCSSDKDDSVSITINNENNNTSNFSKNSENNHTRTLDSDPDLKRMVMEVIFGTPDECSSKQLESETSSFTNDTNSDKKNDSNESKTDCETKDWNDSNSSISSGSLKPQRPIRNRVKPVNKDFIYDLKEAAFRKETVISKGTSYKTLNKKSFLRLNNGEENSDIPVEQLSSKDSVVPLVVPFEQDNNADRSEIKTKSANSKSTTMKISRVPHITQQDGITIMEEK
ncbi:zinc finger protein 800-like isoform X1 [Vespa mandarinia]|uniref:zinc finger protein 800-like isoform X1 n=1 Tax=Vespa mandarinia TaxID=7446 RepID=UPI0016099FCA|nr:zinc finger protein 800-like isoform X1 [Vespa mandarinia]